MVSVLVIDCMRMGLFAPNGTSPIFTSVVLKREYEKRLSQYKGKLLFILEIFRDKINQFCKQLVLNKKMALYGTSRQLKSDYSKSIHGHK